MITPEDDLNRLVSLNEIKALARTHGCYVYGRVYKGTRLTIQFAQTFNLPPMQQLCALIGQQTAPIGPIHYAKIRLYVPDGLHTSKDEPLVAMREVMRVFDKLDCHP